MQSPQAGSVQQVLSPTQPQVVTVNPTTNQLMNVMQQSQPQTQVLTMDAAGNFVQVPGITFSLPSYLF